jgi:hypothetical protein
VERGFVGKRRYSGVPESPRINGDRYTENSHIDSLHLLQGKKRGLKVHLSKQVSLEKTQFLGGEKGIWNEEVFLGDLVMKREKERT